MNEITTQEIVKEEPAASNSPTYEDVQEYSDCQDVIMTGSDEFKDTQYNDNMVIDSQQVDDDEVNGLLTSDIINNTESIGIQNSTVPNSQTCVVVKKVHRPITTNYQSKLQSVNSQWTWQSISKSFTSPLQ